MDYREVKTRNEECMLNAALKRYNQLNKRQLEVKWRPEGHEKPDAIARDGQGVVWIEATNVWFSDEWAKDVHSYVASDRVYSRMRPGLYSDPDMRFSSRFWQSVFKKERADYQEVIQKYGTGLLVVGLEYPLLSGSTILEMQRTWKEDYVHKSLSNFDELYVYWREPDGRGRADRWAFAKVDFRTFARRSLRFVSPLRKLSRAEQDYFNSLVQ